MDKSGATWPQCGNIWAEDSIMLNFIVPGRESSWIIIKIDNNSTCRTSKRLWKELQEFASFFGDFANWVRERLITLSCTNRNHHNCIKIIIPLVWLKEDIQLLQTCEFLVFSVLGQPDRFLTSTNDLYRPILTCWAGWSNLELLEVFYFYS